MTIVEVRVENQLTPLAVSESTPRFSWKFSGAVDGFRQSRSRIQVGEREDFAEVTWDSGMVEQPESHFVPYGGPRLKPKTRYWVRVLAGDSVSVTSWSSPVWFETTPRPGQWSAPFVSPQTPRDAKSRRPKALRRSFHLPNPPVSARLRATALGLYELHLNGTRVGDALLTPGWTAYHKRLAYQTYDVTSLLVPGDNNLLAYLGAGWYKGELTWLKSTNLYGDFLALALELEVWDGYSTWRLTTDGSWEAADTALLYAELYHGETYDARLEGQESWHPARVLAQPSTSLVPQDGPAVRRQLTFAARLLATPQGGQVFDFGQVLTGWVKFRASGSAGERVVLSHAETLDAKGNFYTANLRNARNRIEYILSGRGIEVFEPRFSFQGFRYIRVDDWPGKAEGRLPDPADFTAVVIHSDMEPTLEFSCSHPGLNQLHHNISWGWVGNAVDIPTDCPQRDERLGWTGDAQVFAATAARLRQVDRFFTKWLRDVAADQFPDGAIPFVIPDVLTNNPKKEPLMIGTAGSTGWGDVAVVAPWQVWLATGDLRLLTESWPMMKAWVEFMHSRAGEALVWNTGFHFGDWVALDAKEGSFFGATPNDLTATAYFASSTLLLAKTAEVLGRPEARKYHRLHARIVAAFQREFLTPNGRLAARTQTAHILALVFDLVPARQRQRIIDDLAKLMEENDGHLTTGFLGTPAICDALTLAGRIDLAYDLLLKVDYPSWLYQISRGATTIWEHWDGLKPDGTMWSTKMNSFNHYAYGAVGDWMYRTIGGITPDPSGPGYRRFTVDPVPGGGLTWCRQSLKTPYGNIRVEWNLDHEVLALEVRVPPNSTASVRTEAGFQECGAGTWQFSRRLLVKGELR